MVFFDALRNIEKRLGKAYFHAIIPMAPPKTMEDYKSQADTKWVSLKAVKEAKDDLELLLSITMENPQHIVQQGQHNLKKDELYQLLGINRPMARPPIGAVTVHPVAVKKVDKEEV